MGHVCQRIVLVGKGWEEQSDHSESDDRCADHATYNTSKHPCAGCKVLKFRVEFCLDTLNCTFNFP